MRFNGTHNGMAKDDSLKIANGMSSKPANSVPDNNGAPAIGTHRNL